MQKCWIDDGNLEVAISFEVVYRKTFRVSGWNEIMPVHSVSYSREGKQSICSEATCDSGFTEDYISKDRVNMNVDQEGEGERIWSHFAM